MQGDIKSGFHWSLNKDMPMIKLASLGDWKRSHSLGELRAQHVGSEVTLMGWVHKRRDHGNIIFVDLRDRRGITQVVFDPAVAPDTIALGNELRNEFVIAIKGKVAQRPSGMINSKIPTGEIEVHVIASKLLNRAEPLPFQIHDEAEASEGLRLKYRYLDLRRPNVRDNILKKVKFVQEMRKALESRGFSDFETPLLYKSTPEGAREFLVPSRIHPGQFYALPQSPQLFKQILMMSGFDRYYQVVKCFRDEDLRADRQPEFLQIDCEMSFVELEDVLGVFEGAVAEAASALLGRKITTPFPRMNYDQAMTEYGVDKPDTRFGMKLINLTDLATESEFSVFREAVSQGGIVNAIVVKDASEKFSRKDLDELTDIVKHHGGKGLAWVKKKEGPGRDSWQSPIAKFFSDELILQFERRCHVHVGDLILFGAGSTETTRASLGALRIHLGKKLGLTDPNTFHFLWVINFPLFEKNPDTQRWVACHHPFTSPLPDDIQHLESDPGRIRAAAYDMVLNGNEVAGGSIRIHDPEVQARLFKVLGLTPEETKAKFGFLLEALTLGAPPHGGIAFGLDRLVMVLSGLESIKDVIPFPKTNKGTCMMTDSPTEVSIEQLRDLHIRVQKLNI